MRRLRLDPEVTQRFVNETGEEVLVIVSQAGELGSRLAAMDRGRVLVRRVNEQQEIPSFYTEAWVAASFPNSGMTQINIRLEEGPNHGFTIFWKSKGDLTLNGKCYTYAALESHEEIEVKLLDFP